jgi:capsular polysaccharide biosynthesis protein
MVRRRAVVLALVLVVIGAVAGGVAAQLVPRSYQATSRVFVSSSSVTSVHTLQNSLGYLQQVVASYADVATTPLVLSRVISGLGLSTTPSELAHHVSADAVPNTTLIAITVSEPTAAESARVANAIGTALVDTGPSLSPSGPGAAQVRLDVVEQARASAASTGVNGLAFIGLGAAGGLLAALIILILRSGRPDPPRGSWRLVWVPRSPGEPA